MPVYVAHYQSPNDENRTSGVFEFESEHRAGSKRNIHDARMQMLTLYGNQAIAWQVHSIKAKKSDSSLSSHQMELDFREPVVPQAKKRIVRGFK